MLKYRALVGALFPSTRVTAQLCQAATDELISYQIHYINYDPLKGISLINDTILTQYLTTFIHVCVYQYTGSCCIDSYSFSNC